MKMNSIHSLITLFTVAVFTFSCDRVENPYPDRRSENLTDSSKLDSIELATGIPTIAVKKVLIEDYTGHQCGNCPGAAIEAKNLLNQYGNRVALLAVHVGFFARTDPNKFKYNFTTTTGNSWNNHYGVDNFGLPQGMIDRALPTGSSSPVITVTAWSANVQQQLNKPTKTILKLTHRFKDDSTVQLKVKTKFTDTTTGDYRLVVVLTEDSIIKPQKDYTLPAGTDQTILNYAHRHVLRTAITDDWGDIILNGSAAKDRAIDRYFQFTLKKEWHKEHLYALAFVYRNIPSAAQNREIVQVEEIKLK